MPSRERHQPTLFIIGGAEARTGRGSLLRRFVKLAGGKRARIAVIPTASSFQDEVVTAYTAAFTAFGAAEVTSVNPTSRHAAHDPQLVATLDAATGIYLGGGSQLKLSQFFLGTPAGDAIHRAYARGAIIGGTSAGASIMSDYMISLGEEGTTPKQRTSQLSAGLGLITGCVIDQHFDQRSRYGRLMSVIAPSPSWSGSASTRTPRSSSPMAVSSPCAARGRSSWWTLASHTPMPRTHAAVRRYWSRVRWSTPCPRAPLLTSPPCPSRDSLRCILIWW